MGWYEHGGRFLDVAPATGAISEIGWFAPLGGSTSAAYWLDDEVVLTADYQRGIDILRFSGEPATRTVSVPGPVFQRAALPARAYAQAQAYGCPLPR